MTSHLALLVPLYDLTLNNSAMLYIAFLELLYRVSGVILFKSVLYNLHYFS